MLSTEKIIQDGLVPDGITVDDFNIVMNPLDGTFVTVV